jgi:hypothetical protein
MEAEPLRGELFRNQVIVKRRRQVESGPPRKMRRVNGACGCRSDTVVRNRKEEDVVAIACPDHREYEGELLSMHPNRDDFCALLLEGLVDEGSSSD